MFQDKRCISRMVLAAFCSFVFCATGAAAEPIEEKAKICESCHGNNGVPFDEGAPVIWGQNLGYIFIQLRDFKKGTRQHEIMSPIAQGLERDDMMALAEYFSKKPWPKLEQPAAPKDVAAVAVTANGSVGCTGCHLDKFQGDGTVPRLAGQKQTYLAKTMNDFRSRARANNPGMSDLMNAAGPANLTALAQYLAGL